MINQNSKNKLKLIKLKNGYNFQLLDLTTVFMTLIFVKNLIL